MKVWLDDRRAAPEGWVRVRTPEEAIELLRSGEVEELSLDHDLGLEVGARERTGYDVLLWLEAEVAAGRTRPPVLISVHSGNVAAVGRMEQAIEVDPPTGRRGVKAGASDDRGAKVVDFLWLLLPLAVLAAFREGAEPAGLAVGFALYFVGPLLSGLIMLGKGRSVRAGLLVAALFPILGHIALCGLENRSRQAGSLATRPSGSSDPGGARSDVPELDPDRPLPRWQPAPGAERDPARIDVLIEQLRRFWRRHPHQRLGQLLCNLVGPKPSPLFYVEDHVVSERLLDAGSTQVWPTVHAHPPRWLLEGDAPPADVGAQLRAIAADIEREGAVLANHIAAIMDIALGTSWRSSSRPPSAG